MTTVTINKTSKNIQPKVRKRFGIISIDAPKNISWDIKKDGNRRYKTCSIKIGGNKLSCRIYGQTKELVDLLSSSTIFASAKLLQFSRTINSVDDIRALTEPLNHETWDALELKLSSNTVSNHLCFKAKKPKNCFHCIELYQGGFITYCN